MKPSDIFIHIDEKLDDRHIQELERRISRRDGVVSACVHGDRCQMMLVKFDPEILHSGDILSEVRAAGVHAELVGL